MKAERSSGWKLAGIVLAALGLSVIVVLYCLWTASGRRYARMQDRVQESVEPRLSGSRKRPILQGSPLPGDANPFYLAAENAVLTSPVYPKLTQGLEALSPSDLAAVNAATPDVGRWVGKLRQGACRETVSFGTDSSTMAPLTLSTLLLVAVRRFADEGQARPAAEAILDVCQYGRDVAETRGQSGRIVLMSAFAELRSHLVAGRFDPESLQVLERGLETLDGSFPSTDQEHLRWARTWAASARNSSSDNLLGGLFQRDSYTTYGELTLRALGACTLNWPEERQLLESLDLELAASLNPHSRNSVISLEWCGAYSRHLRAQLRLFRLGTHFLATGEVLDLEDPFGGRLRTAMKGDGLRMWSVGRDGVDDGGDGEWKFKGKDVLLELKRK